MPHFHIYYNILAIKHSHVLHVSLITLVPHVLKQDSASMSLYWKGPVNITGKTSTVIHKN